MGDGKCVEWGPASPFASSIKMCMKYAPPEIAKKTEQNTPAPNQQAQKTDNPATVVKKEDQPATATSKAQAPAPEAKTPSDQYKKEEEYFACMRRNLMYAKDAMLAPTLFSEECLQILKKGDKK